MLYVIEQSKNLKEKTDFDKLFENNTPPFPKKLHHHNKIDNIITPECGLQTCLSKKKEEKLVLSKIPNCINEFKNVQDITKDYFQFACYITSVIIICKYYLQ